jgi:hypothetical protein
MAVPTFLFLYCCLFPVQGVANSAAPSLPRLASKRLSDRLTFHLKGAFYALRDLSKNSSSVAQRGSKLLVIHYTLSNDNAYPIDFRSDSVSMTVVVKSGSQYTADSAALVFKDGRELPVGGEIDSTTFVEIGSDVVSPKLKVRVGENDSITADLSGLPLHGSAFVQPGTGTIFDEIKVKPGTSFDLGLLDVKVQEILPTGGPGAARIAAGFGEHILGVRLQIKNVTSESLDLSDGCLFGEIVGASFAKAAFDRVAFGPGGEADQVVLKPGSTTHAILFFRVSNDLKPKSVRVTDTLATKRSFVVDIH